MKLFSENFHSPLHPYMTHPNPLWPTPALHDPPHSFITHPTPSWTNHPFMTYPSHTGPNSLLHDPHHPFMSHPTPPLHDPPHPFMTHTYMTHNTPSWPTHPFMTHPTPTWHPTPPLHNPPHPYMTQVMNPLLCGLLALPQAMGGRVWSKQPGGGTGQNFKIEGEPMCKFLVTLDTFVGLNG